jgi:phosphoglycerol geranylgeranyltransferase
MLGWRRWKHITKLDPDKKNTKQLVDAVINSGTDAIMVSGTQGITHKKVSNLMQLLKDCDLPIIVEPSKREAVLFDADYVFIPFVLNSTQKWWIQDAHVDWLIYFKKNRKMIEWKRVLSEAYLVLNPRSTVAQVTQSKTNLTNDEIIGYIEYADSLIKFPIVYIEYSGEYGDPNIIKTVHSHIKNAKLFYGGGIDSQEKAKEMNLYATIIVGNIVYKNINSYLTTIL